MLLLLPVLHLVHLLLQGRMGHLTSTVMVQKNHNSNLTRPKKMYSLCKRLKNSSERKAEQLQAICHKLKMQQMLFFFNYLGQNKCSQEIRSSL